MPELTVTTAGGVATVVIDNPSRRNSITLEMWQQFVPLLDELAADPDVRVLVIRGSGENFSAGADIGDLDRILRDPGLPDGAWVTRAEEALAAFPKPTVAAIHGYCVGGGWEIAGACDIRISTDGSTFGITASRIGIVYPLSGISRLVRLAGEATARYLLFSGDTVDASTAFSMGLVTKVVPAAHFAGEIASIATTLSYRSQLSIVAMKSLIGALGARAHELDAELARWQAESDNSDDPAIGAAAFAAREQPTFTWNASTRNRAT
ncbi:MAG TPA: enoyl-CoA hydratase [Microbacteriaceae bacterium]|jgi:enoyl-CoA hydratase/carnithine racemase|nr:enoyl-CoA hydratase [Microbacteriaceae bacterium]